MSLPVRALSLAAAACALAAAPAGAATNGPIAFERGSALYAVPATGGAETVLSKPGYDYEPSYSPDGKRIAFVVNRDIYVADANGANRKPVTTDGAFNASPAWSPDGKKIAYTGGGSGGRPDVFVIPAGGGQRKAVTDTPTFEEYEPAFSPDGKRIAFNRGGAIHVTDAAGATPAVNLTPEARVGGCADQPGYYFNGASREPAWSPDGTHIAFTGPLDCAVGTLGSDIWVMKADGTDKQNLTHDNGTNDRDPVYSPDGERIAFSSNREGGVFIFTQLSDPQVVNAQELEPVQVTDGGDDTDPSWSVKAGARDPEAPGCVVPKLKGKTKAAAKKALDRAGCALGKVKNPKGGKVKSQTKKPGAELKAGAKVGITLKG